MRDSNDSCQVVCTVSGKKQLTTLCLECGRPLSVLTRHERESPERPGERIEVLIGRPICQTGHVYRLASGESYPD